MLVLCSQSREKLSQISSSDLLVGERFLSLGFSGCVSVENGRNEHLFLENEDHHPNGVCFSVSKGSFKKSASRTRIAAQWW